MCDCDRRRPLRSSEFIASVLAAVVLGWPSAAAAEQLGGLGSTRGAAGSEVGSLFHAQRRLEAMGIRDVIRLQAGRSVAAEPGDRQPGSSRFDLYRGRVSAPTLAFLHGVCDGTGGLPRYGEAITLGLLPNGMIELRASALGQLAEPDDRPSRLWIWDAGKLGERVVVRRVTEPRAR